MHNCSYNRALLGPPDPTFIYNLFPYVCVVDISFGATIVKKVMLSTNAYFRNLETLTLANSVQDRVLLSKL